MDPFGLSTLGNVGTILNLQGRFAEAREAFQKMGQLAPEAVLPPTMIGLMFIEEGRPEAALPKIRPVEARFPQMAMFEAMAQARAGNRQEALRLMRPFEDQYPKGPPNQWFALAYAFMDDEPNTVRWLGRGADAHEFQTLNNNVHPAFARMRNGPGFRALKKRIGLDR
jgi:predicted Zn-dependent protease